MENTTAKKLRRLVLTLLCALCLNNQVVILVSARDDPSAKQELITNKSPIIKTLQFKEGDIVDCYDINKQPSLDHHLLKNHKVQTRPSSLPEGVTNFLSEPKNLSMLSKREVCPPGTVPIPRSRKDVSNTTITLDIAYIGHHFPGQHRAFVNMKNSSHSAYNGGGGWMSFHSLALITPREASGAFVMIHNSPPRTINLISAGWMTSTAIYIDDNTRLFIYWTGDGYQTACYNNNPCGGFVQTDTNVYPTVPLDTSTPEQQKGGEFLIFKDKITGNWWLVVNLASHYVVGYWPKEVLPNLVDGGTMVAWGGIAFAGEYQISPPMGSGHFPTVDLKQNSIFSNITYVDETFSLKTPTKDQTDLFHEFLCYSIRNDVYCGDQLRYCFLYGGVGGDCGI